MSQRSNDQQAYDAVTVHLMRKTHEHNPQLFDDVYADLSDRERAEVDAACERHSARMRSKGQRGW